MTPLLGLGGTDEDNGLQKLQVHRCARSRQHGRRVETLFRLVDLKRLKRERESGRVAAPDAPESPDIPPD
jgi:hypothetical protein